MKLAGGIIEANLTQEPIIANLLGSKRLKF